MNRLITIILDNYYTKKFIASIQEDITRTHDVLFRAVSNHGDIDIYLKPYRSSDFTFICGFSKVNALECLLRDRTKFLKFIEKTINDNYDNGTWR